mmetsp:Transcript_5789/g.10858  ORF Transcript_5789/g.10858 Transcript_5789/m.10858 type:complete len:220 (+) Transcript_5789:2009-2668(+)
MTEALSAATAMATAGPCMGFLPPWMGFQRFAAADPRVVDGVAQPRGASAQHMPLHWKALPAFWHAPQAVPLRGSSSSAVPQPAAPSPPEPSSLAPSRIPSHMHVAEHPSSPPQPPRALSAVARSSSPGSEAAHARCPRISWQWRDQTPEPQLLPFASPRPPNVVGVAQAPVTPAGSPSHPCSCPSRSARLADGSPLRTKPFAAWSLPVASTCQLSPRRS